MLLKQRNHLPHQVQHLNKKFWILALVIIVFGFLVKIYAISGNRIFFTVDEGRDAVYARQILNYHQIFTKGPQATLTGLYTGPLWYYVVSLGFSIFKGNPIGAVLILTFLNMIAVLILMIIIKKEISPKIALTTGLGLMLFWPFFTISLWAFNPFALVPLSFILILLLTKNKYGWAAIIIILAFNAELAGAVSLLLFYILIGGFMFLKKKISWKKYLISAFLFPLLGVAKILIDFIKTPRTHLGSGVTHISGTNFKQMAIEFVKIIGQTAIPQNAYIGFLVIVLITIVYLRLKNKNKFTKIFVSLTSVLIFASYLFFSSNHGWSAWHTAYIAPLTFVALFLMLWQEKQIGKTIIFAILVLQTISFKGNLTDYTKPSPNPSLLYNEIKVLDWIYTHSEGNGFNLYTYTNSFYDYPYQYLISWYAVPKYGFYPCEYSNFPLSIKDFYIPGWRNYVEPKLGCDKFRFLIIDSNTNGEANKDWINEFRIKTVFLDKTQIGGTTIEKRKVPDKIH